MTWHDEAPCRGHWAIFYQPDPHEALEMCRSCPSVFLCRAEGDREETFDNTYGVRGGETVSMRLDRRHKDRRIQHGTTAGYAAHKRRFESPCEACAAARRAARPGRAAARTGAA